MSTFANAIENQSARTENGMKARLNTSSALVDLFFKAGASRGKNIVPNFVSAYTEQNEMAMRLALWLRDAREGAGERKLFRDILLHLEKNDPDMVKAVLRKVPELGRWDDLLIFTTPELKTLAFRLIAEALANRNGLCAKWMPRKGKEAVELRKFLGLTPKRYRQLLVTLTNVVETQMCAKEWDKINFSHVPSLAASRYRKAFLKNAPEAYKAYAEKLKSGDKSVKINAGAVYPYDVLKSLSLSRTSVSKTERDVMVAQWDALPNFVGDANILPMVDVSGSMEAPVGPTTALNIAVGLGLYLADKNKGKFNGCFLTFSGNPVLMNLKGDVVDKYDQMTKSNWDMNTDLHKAFELILKTATENSVPQEEMPAMVLILSDMQFDSCVSFDHSAIEMIRHKYEQAGYKVPNVVFWNINARDNAPVKFNEKGVALISGFSPSIVKNVLKAEDLTPEAVMMNTIMNDRYSW